MASLTQIKNRLLARLTTRSRFVARLLTSLSPVIESEDIPWTPAVKPLADCRLALVTTAGVHHRNQHPFDMRDPQGDPSFRTIDIREPLDDLMITHDYYDHADADRDINVVFPIAGALELAREGFVREVARRHYGFMGHIDGRHLPC